MDDRTDTVINIIADMYRKNQPVLAIRRHLSKSGYELSDKELFDKMTDAFKMLDESVDYDEATWIIKTIAQYDDLYTRNYAIQDYRECRSILMEKTNLYNQFRMLLNE